MLTVFGIALIALALGLTARPFFRREESDHVLFTNFPKGSLRNLRERKNLLVLALKELDFDYETGKLSKDDYKGLRDKYETQAVAVMKELEGAEAQWAAVQGDVDARVRAVGEGA